MSGNNKPWVNTGIVVSIAPTPAERQSQERTRGATEWLYKLANFNNELAKMDDRQLLWCVMNSNLWHRPRGSTEDMILQELVDRLYPEFDGEKVRWTSWGWQTPDGEIRYL